MWSPPVTGMCALSNNFVLTAPAVDRPTNNCQMMACIHHRLAGTGVVGSRQRAALPLATGCTGVIVCVVAPCRIFVLTVADFQKAWKGSP